VIVLWTIVSNRICLFVGFLLSLTYISHMTFRRPKPEYLTYN